MRGLSGGSHVADGAPATLSPTHGARVSGIAGDVTDPDSPARSNGKLSPRRRTARLRGRRPSAKAMQLPVTRGVSQLPSDSDSDGDVGRGAVLYASSSESEAETEAAPFGGWRGAMHMLSGVTLSLKKRTRRVMRTPTLVDNVSSHTHVHCVRRVAQRSSVAGSSIDGIARFGDADLAGLRVKPDLLRDFRVGAHELASMVQLIVTRGLSSLGAAVHVSALDAPPDTPTFSALADIKRNPQL